MVIFHSYVKLPEGNLHEFTVFSQGSRDPEIQKSIPSRCSACWIAERILRCWLLDQSMDWFKGKFTGKPWNTPYLVRKPMVSCRFSLKPIHWIIVQFFFGKPVEKSWKPSGKASLLSPKSGFVAQIGAFCATLTWKPGLEGDDCAVCWRMWILR